MQSLRSFLSVLVWVWMLAGIQTAQGTENAEIPTARLDYLERKFQELEHELKALEQSLKKEVPLDEQALVQKSDIPGSSDNNAKEFQLTYHKRSNMPNPAIPEEQSDSELQTFEQQLTPEQQQLLKKMHAKVKYLQAVLHEPQQEPDPNEMPSAEQQPVKKSAIPLGAAKKFSGDSHKRSNLPNPQVPAEELDSELQQFEEDLTPEQLALLKKMNNKIKYLQAVLHEPAPEPDPEEELSAEVKVMEKKSTASEGMKQPDEEEQVLLDYIAKLSPEQQAVLKKNKNNLQLLKAVLNEEPQPPNPGDEGTDEVLEVKKEFDEEGENKEGVTFTAADRELLQEVNKKLSELKKSLEAFKRILIAKEQSSSQKSETEKENKVEKKCQACDCGNKQCDCDACDISAVKRELTNAKSGASAGINLKQLLNVLSRVRANAPER